MASSFCTPQSAKRVMSLQNNGNYGYMTVDPTYINGSGLDLVSAADYSTAMTPIHTSPVSYLEPLSTTPTSTRQRPNLTLDKISPHVISNEPDSARSFDTNGYLTPSYSSTTGSTCSSRRDSIIYHDPAQIYSLRNVHSPSPHARHASKPFDSHAVYHSLSVGNVAALEPSHDTVHGPSSIYGPPPQLDYVTQGLDGLHSDYMLPEQVLGASYPSFVESYDMIPPLDRPTSAFSSFSPEETATFMREPGLNADIPRQPQLQDPWDYPGNSSNSPTWSNVLDESINSDRGLSPLRRRLQPVMKSKYRVSKRTQGKSITSDHAIIDAGQYVLERGQNIPGNKDKPNKCDKCSRAFTRPEHLGRHRRTHRAQNSKQILKCPICFRTIVDRPDNRKAHVIKTHFTASEKKKASNLNVRMSMREVWDVYTGPEYIPRWIDFFGSKLASPDADRTEIWRLIRSIDPRWEKLLRNEMRVGDMAKNSSKADKSWTMLGWTIEEAQSLLVKDIAPEWEGCPGVCAETATLWDIDPRRHALLAGALSVDDAKHLGVDMLKSRAMGLEQCDPRWIQLNSGQMSLEDSERHGVKSLNPQWATWQLSRSLRKD